MLVCITALCGVLRMQKWPYPTVFEMFCHSITISKDSIGRRLQAVNDTHRILVSEGRFDIG